MPPSAHCSAVTSWGGVRSKSGGAADSSATLTRSHLPHDCRTAERARTSLSNNCSNVQDRTPRRVPAVHAGGATLCGPHRSGEDRRPQQLWVIVWTTSVIAEGPAVRCLGTALWISN